MIKVFLDGREFCCKQVIVELNKDVGITFPHSITGNKYTFEQEGVKE